MKTKFLFLLTMMLMFFACSENNSSDEPTPQPIPEPSPIEIDEVDVKIGFSVDVSEETRAGIHDSRSETTGPNDLIGVSILHLSKNQWGGMSPTQYAYGVFDDVSSIIFKLKKDQLYQLQMIYYPDAKNIVYKNSDGTYGVPFNDPYLSSTAYKLNEPQYYAGQNQIFQQLFVLKNIYQNTKDGVHDNDCVRGTTPLYMGTKEFTISEETTIDITLGNCLMGIKFNCTNFNEGVLTLEYEQVGQHRKVDFKPGDELVDWVQIVAPYADYHANSGVGDIIEQGDNIKLYYQTGSEQRYLLATKYLAWKPNTNYVFTFNLEKREDGSIGILLPSSSENQDVEVEFD